MNPRLEHKLEEVSDDNIVHQSTMDRRSLYRSIHKEDPSYLRLIILSVPPIIWATDVLRGKP
ncbi:hypothetical protein B0J17DRAFT_679020 [Rhizoctonia solani]|nr:hypothetical protein B0J17DRAFT_679020 [Rhizoctonia solani]